MKTKKLLLILLIIVLLAVYYTLGMDYMKQRQEGKVLSSQIIETTRALAQIPEPPDDLEARLAAAQASLNTARNLLPDRMNSNEIVNNILKLADDIGIKAIPLVTQPWTTEASGEHSYSVFRLNVAITGNFTQLVSFLSKLENGEMETLVVEDLRVTRVDEPSETESIPEETTIINASLDLAIYTQSPTAD